MTFRYVKLVCQSWFGAVVGLAKRSAAFIKMKAGLVIKPMVFQEPINGGLGHKAALRVREVDGELTRRQARLLKGQIDDRRPDLVRDLVPDPPRSRLAIFQSFDPALLVTAVPFVERRSRDPDRRQCPTDRERRLFHQFDDLELFGCGISHEASSPSPRTLFLSKRFSIRTSARVSLSWRASALSSLTSSEVASRAVSPASRFLPASRNSFDQR